METLDKIQLKISSIDESTQLNFDEWELIDTDLNEEAIQQDQDEQLSILRQYKFVIGISKPFETRIGLKSIQKSKITIKGRLGIISKLS